MHATHGRDGAENNGSKLCEKREIGACASAALADLSPKETRFLASEGESVFDKKEKAIGIFQTRISGPKVSWKWERAPPHIYRVQYSLLG